MKGVNVQKIAALAAGVALLGASVAVADVVYGSTQLVDQNGQPTVKVVVGARAAASDGVAAANIAAAIANQAYKSGVLTPQVVGTATCTPGGGTGSSCTFTNKQVTLEVELPGAAGGAAIFNTLINDWIDKAPGNRNRYLSEDAYAITSSEIGPDAYAFGNGSATLVQSVFNETYKIGASQFAALKSATLTDPQQGNTYSETQSFWIRGKAYYEESSTDDFLADFSNNGVFAWSAKFTHDDYGIPVCARITNTGSDYTDCTGSDKTARHRMKVNFLGDSQWIISDMVAPAKTNAAHGTHNVVTGGSVTFAKEAAYQIINVGETLEAGAISLRLADISTATGAGNVHPAIIDILDSSGTVVKQVQVDPGTTQTETINGVDYKIHIYQTAPGFTLNAKWAEVAVYSDEVKLSSGDQIDTEENKYFRSLLKWKNKGWRSDGNDTNNNQSDTLREIVIYDYETFSSRTDSLKKGGKYSFMASPTAFELQFNGLDLTNDDYDTLTFQIERSSTTLRNCSSNAVDITVPKHLRISSTTDSAFTVGGRTGKEVLYFLGENTTDTMQTVGTLLVKSSGSTVCYDGVATARNQQIQYYPGGDAKSTTGGGLVELRYEGNTSNPSGGGGINVSLKVFEDMGKVNTTTQVASTFQLVLRNITTYDAGFSFLPTTGTTTKYVNYTSGAGDSGSIYVPSPASSTTREEGYYTERGSQFAGLAADNAQFKIAKKIGKLMFALVAPGGNLSSTTSETLGVGATTTFGDIKVTVKDITGTGTCTVGAGGTPLCTPDMTGVSAQVDGQASLETSVPYRLTSKMVMLDSEAPSGIVITVGGPIVNTVTADALEGSDVDFNTDSVVVRVIGDNRIVVAGATAADTMTAADRFIAGITRS